MILAVGFSPEEIDGIDYWMFQGHLYHLTKFIEKLKAKLCEIPVKCDPLPVKAAGTQPAGGMPGGGGLGILAIDMKHLHHGIVLFVSG